MRKAIALLQATDDTFHLARAHILAAYITLARDDADAAERHLDQAEQLLGTSPTQQDLFEITTAARARRAAPRRGRRRRSRSPARRSSSAGDDAPVDEGLALAALGDALALTGDVDRRRTTRTPRRSTLLEEQGRWRDARRPPAARGAACCGRSAARQQALDVLDRAAELGMRATPDGAHVER